MWDVFRPLLPIKNDVFIHGNSSVNDWLDNSSLQDDQAHRKSREGAYKWMCNNLE